MSESTILQNRFREPIAFQNVPTNLTPEKQPSAARLQSPRKLPETQNHAEIAQAAHNLQLVTKSKIAERYALPSLIIPKLEAPEDYEKQSRETMEQVRSMLPNPADGTKPGMNHAELVERLTQVVGTASDLNTKARISKAASAVGYDALLWLSAVSTWNADDAQAVGIPLHDKSASETFRKLEELYLLKSRYINLSDRQPTYTTVQAFPWHDIVKIAAQANPNASTLWPHYITVMGARIQASGTIGTAGDWAKLAIHASNMDTLVARFEKIPKGNARGWFYAARKLEEVLSLATDTTQFQAAIERAEAAYSKAELAEYENS